MSRRIMGAGLGGSISNGSRANVNQIQFGDKLQGLATTTGKKVDFNSRAIRRRSYGNKRNVVFCVNQLGGGVGRRKGMFASNSDGVKNCFPGVYGKSSSSTITVTYTIGTETSTIYTNLYNEYVTDAKAETILQNMLATILGVSAS